MTSLQQEFQTILGHLVRLQRPAVRLLQEPLRPEEIRFRLQEVQLLPTDELTELYSWKNGTKSAQGNTLGDMHFFPGFYFMSLDKAIQAYHAWAGREWNLAWFPVFANGGGDFYAVELSHNSAKESAVVGFMLGQPEQDVEFESLLSMARTISACYDVGIYRVGDKGYLEANYEAIPAIAKKFNPTLDLYK
jgi:hypothetical protein